MQVSIDTAAGSKDVANEDWTAATPRIAVVADGVTTPAGMSTGCVHGTPWYVRYLTFQIMAYDAARPTADLRDVLAAALAAVAAAHKDTCDLRAAGTPSAALAIVRHGATVVDFLVLADATVLLGLADGIQVHTDNRGAKLFGELREAVLAAPVGSAAREARLAELVKTQRELRNVDGGYWLAGATPGAAQHALVGSVARSEVHAAAAFTDGASRLVDVFRAVTWPEALHVLRDNGPRQWIERVRAIESTDDALTRWPRYKHGDDATVASITFA